MTRKESVKMHEDLPPQALADLYAEVSNTYLWYAGDSCWLKPGTDAYEKAVRLEEGVTIPEKGQLAVIAPFMERYGWIDSAGWWIKEKNVT